MIVAYAQAKPISVRKSNSNVIKLIYFRIQINELNLIHSAGKNYYEFELNTSRESNLVVKSMTLDSDEHCYAQNYSFDSEEFINNYLVTDHLV